MSRLRGLLVVLISVWLALLVDGAAMVTSERVASMWRRVGGTRSSCATAVAVAMAESSFNCEAYNVNPATKSLPETVDRGLFQINSHYHAGVSRECAYDCACNVREAHRISRKGSNWTPWTSFKHNRHSPYLPMATEVCARVYASEGL
jgi:hypothetical protein